MHVCIFMSLLVFFMPFGISAQGKENNPDKKLENILRAHGLSDQDITDFMKNFKHEGKNVTGEGSEGKNSSEKSVLKSLSAFNTLYGVDAGASLTNGNFNSFFGETAGYSVKNGFSNNFFGAEAGHENIEGFYNVFIGVDAGFSNQESENIFIGNFAGRCSINGTGNCFIGNLAGYNNGGSDNIYIGNAAGYNATGSNKLYIANNASNTPLLYGEFDNKIVTVHGKLGINTKTPLYTIEANTTGSNAALAVKRIGGSTAFITGTESYSGFGSVTFHPVLLMVNGIWKLRLNGNGFLKMSSGAYCTTSGVWTDSSSRTVKENIYPLDTTKAMDTLAGLTPVVFNYKIDKSDMNVGFIAEDVPELVASADRKGLSPMDITAVLTKVVQEQQKMIRDLKEENKEYKTNLSDIKKRLEQLEKQK
ncbi:MAG: hypothetical protein QG657_4225 [Acidobacteriota bacterium]|nr:hypothetical protein [Acidobacteriota bacterium]